MFIQPDIPASIKTTTPVVDMRITGKAVSTYRTLYFFHFAALALFFCGVMASPHQQVGDIILSAWFVCCGVFMIYRFNDIIDHAHGFRFNRKRITASPLHMLFILQLICIATPAAWIWLSPLRLTLLSLIGVIGILYSVPLRVRGRVLRIKHTFLLKNITIGTLWGLLPALGADALHGHLIISITIFAAMQVTMGSVLRDVADRDHDAQFDVHTLPVIWGVPRTLLMAHAWNVLSLVMALLLHPSFIFGLALMIPVLWRSFTLIRINKDPDATRWTHTMNLLTCVVLFITFTIYQLYVGHI